MRTPMPLGILLFASLLAGAAESPAQNPIQWRGNARQGVQEAQNSGRPVLFYIPGSSDDDDELEDAQKRTFRDPLVHAIAHERFVPVRLPRSSSNLKLLRDYGLPTGYGNYLVVTSPWGDLVGAIAPHQAASPRALTQRLTELYRTYRGRVFREEIQPVLEDGEAEVGEIRRALRQVREMLILSADELVIEQFDRSTLPTQLQADLYDTLAVLSTQPAIEVLLDRAVSDPVAQRCLERATSGAAGYLLDAFDLDDPARTRAAYNAATKICDIQPKSAQFWVVATRAAQERELERVRAPIEECAAEWRNGLGALR